MTAVASETRERSIAYRQPVDEVATALGTDVERGLSDEEARSRLEQYGRNELAAEKPIPAWRRFVAQFQDVLVILLLVATAISAGLWAYERDEALPYEAIAILAVVLLNAVLGYVQEARAESAVAALRAMSASDAAAIRGGERRSIPASDIVPGDILLIEEGDTIPADGRLVESTALQVAEAALTGESEPVIKDTAAIAEDAALGDRHNTVFSGTAATYGHGKAIVTATGMRTEIGRIAQLLKETHAEATPLQRELDKTGRLLGIIVVVIAVVMIATIIIVENVRGLAAIFDVLILGVALAVAAVPEGLPAVVTAVLSIGVQRMARRNAIVRHLAAVETLGSASVIASDKTGTLTKNEMTVRVVVTASGRVTFEGSGYEPTGKVTREGGGPIDGPIRFELEKALKAADRANNAVVLERDGRWTVQGDPTEGALLVAARKCGLRPGALDEQLPRVGEVPFSSERKLMSTIHRDTEQQERGIVFTKGAPDVLLTRCSFEVVGDDRRPLTPERRAEILQANEALAGEALRTLGVAGLWIPANIVAEYAARPDERIEHDLVFAGLIGMIDPPRAEAKEAVARAKAAGIRPIMITGDHPRTAAVIAQELGIVEDGRAITGAEFEKMPEEARSRAVAEVSVYARVNPEHKLWIVEALRRTGAVVAMTGDGVNDAPALKKADIGIAMGITGTDVSKEAADMVLADDNFASIVAAVEEGRGIFANIRKFLRYLLSSNIGEVLTMFFGVVLAERIGLRADSGGVVLPLLATQILWINLVTDGTPALALGVDPPDEDLMRQPPRPAGEGVITPRMWSGIAFVGVIMAVGTLFVLDASLPGGFLAGSGDLPHAQTMAFTTLMLFQMINVFNARSDDRSAFAHLFTNRWLWAAVGSSIVLQVAVVSVPLLQRAFGTVALTGRDWLFCAAVASSVLWLRELSKLFARVMPSRRLAVFFGAALLTATAACKPKPAPVEELYTARMLGLSYLQRNQLPEAEAEFKKLTKLAPDDPLGYANLGLTYLQAGRFADAEKQLGRARELDPASAEIGLALARLYSLTKRPADALATLEQLRRDSTANAHVLFALAELEAQKPDSASARRYEERLREVLAIAPGNLAARLKLVAALARRGEADSVVRHLEEVRRIPPEPPKEARTYLNSAIQLLRAGKLAEARATLDRFFSLMEVTAPYQASLDEVKWTDGPIAGRPVLTFAPKTFISLHGVPERAAIELAKFIDATSDAGLPTADGPAVAATGQRPEVRPTAIAAGDVDGDGTDDLFVSTWSPTARKSDAHLYRVQGGFVQDVTQRSGISLPQGAAYATFTDYDNDGWLDLFVIGGEGHGHLFRNSGTGTFAEVTGKAGVGDVRGARKALFVDLDHDGDLDLLLVGKGQSTVYRNNLDGTFTEATSGFGLGGTGDARDAAFGDFDGDGRIDVFVTNGHGSDELFHNGGAERFSDVTATSGLASNGGSGPAAVGDYNNDGLLDLFVASTNGGGPALWLNKGDGTFSRDLSSNTALQPLRSISGLAATFVDYDNDGWLDLVVAGTASSSGRKSAAVFLFRNDGTGRFLDRSTVLPEAVRTAGASAIVVSDVDDDGDEDLLLIDGAGAPRLLRNDLGNSNLALNVELKALRDGSGKNNTLGIGARVELRAGELYQTRVATGRVTHFGLGAHLKADVLRIEWPNGVPQVAYFPGTDQDVVEREMLKGSCAFAYTWDGTRFRFVTDAMWRSALGMPLGLMGSTSAFAPAGASQEYVRIPGDALRPRNGRYIIQLTEELWETAYADEVKLLAVDHPDSVDVFVDERFVPPGPVSLRLFQVAQQSPPVSATDERGNDVLPALRASDDVYVSNFTPTKYQGVVESHDLVMDLGDSAGRPGTLLFLRGWIYPTDASINVALGQQSSIKLASPSLEVRDANGRWRTAIANIGFPSGKDKTIIIDLAGKFPTADHRVRIRTNMQIYWDQAFVARDLPNSSVKVTTLAPTLADLHTRGFSRMYRKGGRYGPYWFAYDEVAKDSPWRTIEGAFTRFGDVLTLLRSPDDMYVIMAPGDETTIEFDASSANALPPGWKRDFLLYTDGWIKDSDLNTAFGTTVGPLPYHGVRSYPYGPGDAYPADSQHQRYLREYDTRVVKGREPSSQ